MSYENLIEHFNFQHQSCYRCNKGENRNGNNERFVCNNPDCLIRFKVETKHIIFIFPPIAGFFKFENGTICLRNGPKIIFNIEFHPKYLHELFHITDRPEFLFL